MKDTFKRTAALVAALALLFTMTSCSFADDLEARRKERNSGKKHSSEMTIDETEPDETEPDETEPTDTPAVTPSVKAGTGDDMIFETEDYSYDKVHPKHAPGKITGEEAKKELAQIEKDFIAEAFEEDYVSLEILFADPSKYGITDPKVTWGTIDYDGYEEDIKQCDAYLERLYSLDYETMDEDDRIFYDKICYDIEESRYWSQFTGYGYMTPVFNSFTSQQCEVLFILDVLEFNTVEDADNYILLLKDLDRYYDELCAFEEKRVEYGYAMSDSGYEDAAVSFDNLVAQKDDCFLYESFEKRLENIKGLSSDDKSRLISEHESAMKTSVFPRFEDCAKRLRALKGNCKNEGGLCNYEHGAELYRDIMRTKSNSQITPEEAADLIDEQLKSINQSLMYLSLNGVTSSPSISKGDTTANLDFLKDAIKPYFPDIPDHKYTLREVPEVFRDSFSPAAYLGYHLDSFDSNLILINTASEQDDFGATCAHEGYPGHMYQSLYTRNATDHLYMSIFDSSGYAEGWAQYVEVNAPTFFGLDSNEASFFLDNDLLNVYIMARIDIGVNYEGWDSDDIIEHFKNIFGYNMLNPSGIQRITDICIQDPGYPLTYCMGYILTTQTLDKIYELDSSMSLKDIHKTYLDALPGTFEQIYDAVVRKLNK